MISYMFSIFKMIVLILDVFTIKLIIFLIDFPSPHMTETSLDPS